MPDFHDGFFDGLWISDPGRIHLFLMTVDKQPFTLVLSGVKAMNVTNVKKGNIILELMLLDTQQLTAEHIYESYELFAEQRESQVEKLLSSARRGGLSALQMSSSYGAECTAIFRRAEFHPNHILDCGERPIE
jgi:hypothetical protein